MGDPNGIGIEVILKALQPTEGGYTIIGSMEAFAYYQKLMGLNKIIDRNHFVDIGLPIKVQPGIEDIEAARAAVASLNKSIEMVKKGELKAIITAPLSKRLITKIIPGFIGHTEYLANRFGCDDVAMLGVRGPYRILFYTTHIPLQELFKRLNPDRIKERIVMLAQVLKRWFGIERPKIMVAGINPHTFEFSRGEEEIIVHSIDLAREEGISAEGPMPADAIFQKECDGYLVFYHDQGMIYLKSRPGGSNLTVGLPCLRGSPLHGTGFDIAGRGRADPISMIETINIVEATYDRL